MQKVINSLDNQVSKQARAVRDGKVRDAIFIEGLRLCEEARAAALKIADVLYTERLLEDERAARLLQALQGAHVRTAILSERVMASISDTKSPQGILMLAERPRTESLHLKEHDEERALLIVLHRINNPANAGAILRTAEAAGVSGAIITRGSADIFSPKALRGAMGSSFRLPLWTGAEYEAALDWCARRHVQTVCADVRGSLSHTELDWTTPRALVVGPEANGLSAHEAALTDEAIRIPMRPPVESLNVAAATAVILYEAARQRTKSNSQ